MTFFLIFCVSVASADMLMWSADFITAMRKPHLSSRPGDVLSDDTRSSSTYTRVIARKENEWQSE